MKNILTIFVAISLFAIACQNNAPKPAAVAEPTKPEPTQTEPAPTPPIVGASTSVCYQLVDKSKDKHTAQITTRATQNPYVSGYFDWSPFEKDGGHGILKNMRNEGDLLVADFTYMIEGSVQTEEVYFKVEADKLTKMRTELTEKGGKLVAKDKSKLKPEMVMPKVDCSVTADIVKMISEFEAKLK